MRLEFLRRWFTLAALPGLPMRAGSWDQDEPAVAVTLARMRLPRCGGSSVTASRSSGSGATTRGSRSRGPPYARRARSRRSPCGATFFVGRSVWEMEEMVHGRSDVPNPGRHATAVA